MDIDKLIDAAAAAAVESAGTSSDDELAALLNHGKEARLHVWDAHYANKTERVRLAEKLAASSPEFQLAVAATERILADELAESRARIERIRAENPNLYKDYQ
jgi:hypothetical protein